jgi:hypothetical protein
VLNFSNNPNARDWVRTERAGTVITFQIAPSSNSNETVTGFIKVFDEVGNLVNSASTQDALASVTYDPNDGGGAIDYDIYWNGSNQRGLRVAPGVYRILVYLTYTAPANTKQRLSGTVGVSY